MDLTLFYFNFNYLELRQRSMMATIQLFIILIKSTQSLFLCFLLPFHIVASKRVLVNTTFPFDINIQFNPQETCKNMVTDIEVDTPRGQSNTFSTNSFKTTLVYSDVSSTVYVEQVQALASNPT